MDIPLLDRGGVAVVDPALFVKVFRFGPSRVVGSQCVRVERIVDIQTRDIVDGNIRHEKHAAVVQSLAKRLQVVRGSKTRIGSHGVIDPVSVIGVIVWRVDVNVLTCWGYPDGVKAHSLNIVQLVDDGKPCSTTPGLECWVTTFWKRVRACWCGIGGWGESVSEKSAGQRNTVRVGMGTYWYMERFFHSSAVAAKTGDATEPSNAAARGRESIMGG